MSLTAGLVIRGLLESVQPAAAAAAATLAWPCRLSTERFNGSYQTASHEAHGPASDASKSQYGE